MDSYNKIVLKFDWYGDNNEIGKGAFYWDMNEPNSFTGTWGNMDSEIDGGEWNGTRIE